MVIKIYTVPQTEHTHTTLQAYAGSWRELLALRPVSRDPTRRPTVRDGETISDADWRDAAGRIGHAIDGCEDSDVVRIRFAASLAGRITDMAKE